MSDAKTRTVKLSEAREDLGALVDAAVQGQSVVLEQDGSPVAAIVSGSDFDMLLLAKAKREELFKALDETRALFADVPEGELEREIEKALKKVRRDMAAEQRKAKSPAA